MKTVEGFSDDAVLLKLYRRYGKDEALNYLFDEISKQRFQIGELKSENEELMHDKKQVEKELAEELRKPNRKERVALRKQFDKDDYIKELLKQILTHQDKRRKAEQDKELWQSKFLNLQARIDKTFA